MVVCYLLQQRDSCIMWKSKQLNLIWTLQWQCWSPPYWKTATQINLGLRAHLLWIKTEDLHEILLNNCPGSNPDPVCAAIMRGFKILGCLVNTLSSSTTKNKITILAAWEGVEDIPQPHPPPKDKSGMICWFVAGKLLILIDFNCLATITIIPLETKVTSYSTLIPGNEVK